MNLFKLSYKICRKNGNEIYKGFGFHHLSDVTHYYVHPDNQSFNGTTTLCQPIGEAITLLSLLVMELGGERAEEGEGVTGGYYYDDDGDDVYLDMLFPEDWRQNGIVDRRIFRYRARIRGEACRIGTG